VRFEILKYVNSHTIGCAKYSLCDYAACNAKFIPRYFVTIHLLEQWISGVRDDSFLFYYYMMILIFLYSKCQCTSQVMQVVV